MPAGLGKIQLMIWLVGIVGFISGFAAGQMILLRLLKDRTRDELLSDRSLRWRYGLFNWLIAIGTCVCAIITYRHYFPD